MLTALSVVALIAGVVSIILADLTIPQARLYDIDAKNGGTGARASGIKAQTETLHPIARRQLDAGDP